MIDKGLLTAKLREISEMKGQRITRETVDFLHKYVERFDLIDLESAVNEIIWEDEKFVPVKLKRAMERSASKRRENSWESEKLENENAAKKFFAVEFDGTCNREACRGCQRIEGCKIRGREWIRGIKSVLEGNNAGSEHAKELIRYMQWDFMGGIK